MRNGWTRLGQVALAIVTLLALRALPTLDAATAAKFPSQLFTYADPPGRTVRLLEFAAQGREIEAMQRTLGTNLANIPAPMPCAYIEAPPTLHVGDTKPAFWPAPRNLHLTAISCELIGGTSVQLDLAIRHLDNAPVSVTGANISCVPGQGVPYTALGGQTAMQEGDRLDVNIGTVVGSPTALRLCWKYAGA